MNASAYFFIRTDRKYVRLCWNDILFLDSMDNYIKVHTEKSCYLVPMTVKHLVEEELPSQHFARVNRGIVVAIAHITSFDHHEVRVGQHCFSFGKGYRKELESKIRIMEMHPPATSMKVGPTGLEADKHSR